MILASIFFLYYPKVTISLPNLKIDQAMFDNLFLIAAVPLDTAAFFSA